MRAVSEAFRSTVQGSHRRASRVTILDAQLRTLTVLSGEDGYVINGTVSMDTRRPTQRTLSMTIANPHGIWTPEDASSYFFWTRYLRVERGVWIGHDKELVPLGTFVMDRPIVDVSGASELLTVQASDRLRIAQKSRFAAPTTYAAGALIGDVIRDLAADAGMGTELYLVNDGGKTLAATRTFEVGADVVQAMVDVARDYGLRLYCSALGHLVLEPVPDPADAAPAWRFERGEQAVMTGISKGWSDDGLYNEIVVTGEAADLAVPARAVAQDLNPASPAYVFGPMGRRTFFYTSPMIRTNAQAQDVADAFLFEKALIEEEISVPSVVLPFIEPYDTIEVSESVSRTEDRYVIDSVQVPLGGGTMQLGARKLRRLS